MYLSKIIEVLGHIGVIGSAFLSIYIVCQMQQEKKKNPQDHIKIRLLWIEAVIWMAMATMFSIGKNNNTDIKLLEEYHYGQTRALRNQHTELGNQHTELGKQHIELGKQYIKLEKKCLELEKQIKELKGGNDKEN